MTRAKVLSKERNANLELLRIISMILIVMSHSDDWMGLMGTYQLTICVNKFITDWLHLGGQIGVGCFLLISGYFMVDQQFRPKRLFRLLGEVWFYSICFGGVFLGVRIGTGEFSFSSDLGEVMKAVFPVLLSHYWFVTAYVILMILSPFFNKLISVMDKSMYQRLLAILITIFFILDGGFPGVLSYMAEGRLIPVFIMYFVAGYIKKFVDNNKNNSKKHLKIAILGYLLLYATFIWIGVIGEALNSVKIISYCYFFRPLNSPIVLVINVELFLAFLRMKSIKGKWINAIAGNTFGVYLIHTNSVILGVVLPALFPVYKETNSLRLFFYSIGSVTTVYIVCILIDMIRQKTVEKVWLKLLDDKYDKFEEKIEGLITRISGRIRTVLRKYYE